MYNLDIRTSLAKLTYVIVVAVCALPSTAEPWTVVNLNKGDASSSAAYAVSGSRQAGSAHPSGVVWQGTADSQRPLTPGASSFATGISATRVVGYVGFVAPLPALWTGVGSGYTDLLPPGGLDGQALGVSESAVVGAVGFADGAHAALWSGAVLQFVDLHPSVANFSVAAALDGEKQVGNYRLATGGSYHAALWHGTAESAVDLHPAGAYASSAQAIADGRQGGYVQFERDGTYYPAVWSGTAESFVNFSAPGAPTDAGVIYGMQGNLLVGGARFLDGSGGATIWFGTPESAFNLASLLSSDYTRSEARAVDIDEFGTIRVVGYAYNNNYYLPDGTHYPRNEAMMWVLVPEPSSLVALAAGLAALAKFRWRR